MVIGYDEDVLLGFFDDEILLDLKKYFQCIENNLKYNGICCYWYK